MLKFFKLFIFFCLLLTFSDSLAAVPDMNVKWSEISSSYYSSDIFGYYPYDKCFKKASEKYNISPVLLLAVAKGESDFNPRDSSNMDCHGIMQIRWPVTARELGFNSRSQLFDPCRNIMAGAKYLRKMLDLHNGNTHLALAAYHHGPGNIHRNISPYLIPKKAKWYSGYIYHHMETISKREDSIQKGRKIIVYERAQKLPIIVFHELFRVKGFIGYIHSKDPDIRLEWFRSPLYQYYVVMLYKSDEEKNRSIKSLAEIGFRVDETKKF